MNENYSENKDGEVPWLSCASAINVLCLSNAANNSLKRFWFCSIKSIQQIEILCDVWSVD